MAAQLWAARPAAVNCAYRPEHGGRLCCSDQRLAGISHDSGLSRCDPAVQDVQHRAEANPYALRAAWRLAHTAAPELIVTVVSAWAPHTVPEAAWPFCGAVSDGEHANRHLRPRKPDHGTVSYLAIMEIHCPLSLLGIFTAT